MKTDPESAQQALLNARRAIEQGDRQASRRWAERAAALCPDLEEPWLILAAFGSPRASVEYLEQALRINPHSQHARKGMHWAVDRLRKETEQRKCAGIPSDKLERRETSRPGSSLEPVTRPRVGEGFSCDGRPVCSCVQFSTIQILDEVPLVIPDLASAGSLCDGGLGTLAWQCLASDGIPACPAIHVSGLCCADRGG